MGALFTQLTNVATRNQNKATCDGTNAVLFVALSSATDAWQMQWKHVGGDALIVWSTLNALSVQCDKCDGLRIVCDFASPNAPQPMFVDGNYSSLDVLCPQVPSLWRVESLVEHVALRLRDRLNVTIDADSLAGNISASTPMESCFLNSTRVCADEADRLLDALHCTQREAIVNKQCRSCGNGVLNFGELCDNGKQCLLAGSCSSLVYNETTCECQTHVASTVSLPPSTLRPVAARRWWPIAVGVSGAVLLIVTAVFLWRRRQRRRRIGAWGVLVDETSSRGTFRAVDKPAFAII